jgi:thymidylate synthase
MRKRTHVDDIREEFIRLLELRKFVTDKSGCKMLEIISASFTADEPTVFGSLNDDYVTRELEWYRSMSRNVNDIPGGPPAIWKQVATPDGLINSNYGWCIWSQQNFLQYENVKHELEKNPFSRRAVMIYTRPEMWLEYNTDGMSDFMCTNAVQYVIRNDKLDAIVQMRSNDVWAGYRNDLAWQRHVQKMLAADLNILVGTIYWNAGSLHCYSRDFYLIDHYRKTGKLDITRKQYRELYPTSEFV